MNLTFDRLKLSSSAHWKLSLTAAVFVSLATLGCNASAPPSAAVSGSTARSATPDHSPRSARFRQNDGGGLANQNDDQSDGRGSRRRSRRGRPQAEAKPGQFDFYLLNLSWSPEFCATHGNSPECGRRLGFVVHGLWPQNNSGDYPEHCSNAPGPSNPQADTDIIPTVSLVEHEWQTHGTCSGLGADDYFSQIHKAYAAVSIPASIGAGNDANGVSADNLLGRFEAANPDFPKGSFALSCGNNRLTAVEICLNKTLQPEACQGVRSCRATLVKVTPP